MLLTADEINTIGFLIALVASYVFPSFLAFLRNHHQTRAIVVLNLAFGWTVLGWIGALIWASTAVETRPDLQRNPAGTAIVTSRPCRACKMLIHPEATICPHCRTEGPHD